MSENTTPQSEQFFLKAVHDSLCDGIQNLLGKGTLDALVENYHLDKLTNAPQELHNQLSQIFGTGAVVLERIIVKELFSTCDLSFEDTQPFNFNLGEHLIVARREFEIKTVWRVESNGGAN